MEELPEVGPILRKLRSDKNLTLEELSVDSGVSRSMVSQIERGEANPTFATLWKLTQALDVDLNELTTGAAEPESIVVASAEETPQMRVDSDGVVLRILSPVDLADVAEWYEISILPGRVLVSAPHAVGTMEHLTVIAGELDITSGDATSTVPRDATARYRADRHHEIRNNTSAPARALLVVITRSVK